MTEDILKVKNELDSAKQNLIEVLAKDVKNIFTSEYNDSISLHSAMNDWYELLNKETKTNLFNKGEEKFLEEVESTSNNYSEFMENIARILTGLKIDDWDDNTVMVFVDRVKEFKNSIEEFNNKVDVNKEEYDNSTYRISFLSDGKEEIRSIVKQDNLSHRAKFFSNELDSLMEDYNAVDINEKRQILLEMLLKCK